MLVYYLSCDSSLGSLYWRVSKKTSHGLNHV